MATIGSNSVALSENWGAIKFYDYTFNGARMDFQDLMVAERFLEIVDFYQHSAG